MSASCHLNVSFVELNYNVLQSSVVVDARRLPFCNLVRMGTSYRCYRSQIHTQMVEIWWVHVECFRFVSISPLNCHWQWNKWEREERERERKTKEAWTMTSVRNAEWIKQTSFLSILLFLYFAVVVADDEHKKGNDKSWHEIWGREKREFFMIFNRVVVVWNWISWFHVIQDQQWQINQYGKSSTGYHRAHVFDAPSRFILFDKKFVSIIIINWTGSDRTRQLEFQWNCPMTNQRKKKKNDQNRQLNVWIKVENDFGEWNWCVSPLRRILLITIRNIRCKRWRWHQIYALLAQHLNTICL